MLHNASQIHLNSSPQPICLLFIWARHSRQKKFSIQVSDSATWGISLDKSGKLDFFLLCQLSFAFAHYHEATETGEIEKYIITKETQTTPSLSGAHRSQKMATAFVVEKDGRYSPCAGLIWREILKLNCKKCFTASVIWIKCCINKTPSAVSV